MNGRARRLAALNVFDLSDTTDAIPAASDETDRLWLGPVVDPCRCGHAQGGHLQAGFYPGERERCVASCNCTAFRDPWLVVLRAHAWGVLLGLALSVLLLALMVWGLS